MLHDCPSKALLGVLVVAAAVAIKFGDSTLCT
jgi:hypothetical protein